MCLSRPRIPEVPEPKPIPPPPPPTPMAQMVKSPPRRRRREQRRRGNPLVIQRETGNIGVNTGGMQSGAGLY